MSIRKCPSCGGEMEVVSNKRMFCPFCNTNVDVDIKDADVPQLLDENMFDLLWKYDSLKQYENVNESLESMSYCLNSLRTADSVAEFISTALISDTDVATEGINQERIDKVMPKICDYIESGEHIIVYGDEGLFSKGKEFFVITGRRSIFADGKKISSVLHSEVSAMCLKPNGGYPRWLLNNREEFYISGLGNKYRLHGAVAALICLFSWEARKAKIKIM